MGFTHKLCGKPIKKARVISKTGRKVQAMHRTAPSEHRQPAFDNTE